MKKILILFFLLITISCSGLASTLTVTEGSFDLNMARNMLPMVNDLRTGDDAWYWNDDDETKTVLPDLEELVYDYALERTAMQRAAELAIYYSHTRPDLTQPWTAYPNGYGWKGENIAYGYTTSDSVFTAWAEEDKTYSGQGHRRNMLNGNFNRIGIGCFYHNGRYFWSQEFGSSTGSTSGEALTLPFTISFDNSLVNSLSMGSLKLVEGETKQVPLTVNSYAVGYVEEAVYGSSDSSVFTVSGTTLTAVNQGTATLTVSLGELTTEASVTVKDPNALPESDHPYAANTDETWTYTHPTVVESLSVTFSEDTVVEQSYDFIYITDDEGTTKYTGTELAGATITLKGRSFSIRLTSDSSEQENGFTIVSINEAVTFSSWFLDAIQSWEDGVFYTPTSGFETYNYALYIGMSDEVTSASVTWLSGSTNFKDLFEIDDGYLSITDNINGTGTATFRLTGTTASGTATKDFTVSVTSMPQSISSLEQVNQIAISYGESIFLPGTNIIPYPKVYAGSLSFDFSDFNEIDDERNTVENVSGGYEVYGNGIGVIHVSGVICPCFNLGKRVNLDVVVGGAFIFPSGLKTIESEAFKGVPAKQVVIPSGTTYSEDAFDIGVTVERK